MTRLRGDARAPDEQRRADDHRREPGSLRPRPHGSARRPRHAEGKGISLVAASAPTHFIEDTPTAILVRQVLGAIAEFEKATLVAKLAAARRRKRMATGKKVEGRKSDAEARPDVVKLAKALARKKPKGGRLSLRAISAALATQGFLNERGKPSNPKSVAAMLAA